MQGNALQFTLAGAERTVFCFHLCCPCHTFHLTLAGDNGIHQLVIICDDGCYHVTSVLQYSRCAGWRFACPAHVNFTWYWLMVTPCMLQSPKTAMFRMGPPTPQPTSRTFIPGRTCAWCREFRSCSIKATHNGEIVTKWAADNMHKALNQAADYHQFRRRRRR